MPAEYGAQFPLNIASGELILLEYGGHGNFLNTDWFRNLLRAKFSQVPVACRLSPVPARDKILDICYSLKFNFAPAEIQ